MFQKLKVTAFGVSFNYKKDNLCIWLYCIIIIVMSMFFMATSSIFYEYYKGEKISLKYYLMGETLIISAQCLPFLMYVILLKSLHVRLVTVNTLLRFTFLFISNQMIKNFNSIFYILSFYFSYRKQFMSIDTSKDDLIKFVKFSGRQHSFLTGLMDQINLCYSFQVKIIIRQQFIINLSDARTYIFFYSR